MKRVNANFTFSLNLQEILARNLTSNRPPLVAAERRERIWITGCASCICR